MAFELLLQHPKIDINMESKGIKGSLLTQAIQSGKKRFVEVLLNDPRIDVNYKLESEDGKGNKQELTPLYLALKKDIEIAQLILNHPNVDVNLPVRIGNIEMPPFVYAASLGNLSLIQSFLNNPQIDVNKSSNGFNESNGIINIDVKTALHYAVQQEKTDIVRALLSHPNIDVNPISITRQVSESLYKSEEKNTIAYGNQK